MHCQRKEEVKRMSEKLYGVDQFYPGDFAQILIGVYKNRVHAILTRHGIIIHATDIFGRRGIRSILEESSKLPAMDRIVL